MSEFERFFKNSKIRKPQVLCAITFGGIATHLKFIAAFESQKTMFFEEFNKAPFLTEKNMTFCDSKAATTFGCVAIPPKVMAHNT